MEEKQEGAYPPPPPPGKIGLKLTLEELFES